MFFNPYPIGSRSVSRSESRRGIGVIMLCTDVNMLAPFQSAVDREISTDPRQWSRNDVKLWLQTASVQHQLLNTFPEKFPMNGKGLLLLTRDMFIERVPVGGALLYEDLHLKVQKMVSDQLRQVQELELMLHPGVINH